MQFPFGWFREKKPVEAAKLSASSQVFKLNYATPAVVQAQVAAGTADLLKTDFSNAADWNNAISSDANNMLQKGSDGKLYVKGGTLSQGKDSKLFATVAPPKPAGKTIVLNTSAYNGGYWTIGVNGASVANINGGSLNLYEGSLQNDGHTYSINGKVLNISTDDGTITADNIWILAGGTDFYGSTVYITFYPDTGTVCTSQNASVAPIWQNPNYTGTVNLLQV